MELLSCSHLGSAFSPFAACLCALSLSCTELCVVLQVPHSVLLSWTFADALHLLKPLSHHFFTCLFVILQDCQCRLSVFQEGFSEMPGRAGHLLYSWGALCLSPLALTCQFKVSVYDSSLLDCKFLEDKGCILYIFLLAPNTVPSKQEVYIEYVS